MAGCSLLGLMFAPASHGAALGPGCVPAFVLLISVVVLRKRCYPNQVLALAAILLGAISLMATSSDSATLNRVFVGDALFIIATLLAACYLVFIEHHRVPALAATAVVMVCSGAIVVPSYLLFSDHRLLSASGTDVAVQMIFQGVLMPLAYLATHQAVLHIGGARVTMIMASIPVLTMLAGHTISRDQITPFEILSIVAISLGVVYGGFYRLRNDSPLALGGASSRQSSFRDLAVRIGAGARSGSALPGRR